MPDGGPRSSDLRLHFQPKQWLAFLCKATELLFGGAAFGAKSHLLRLAAIQWCIDIPGLMIYLFRRVEDELIKNHMEGPMSFPNLLAPWVASGHVKITELKIEFLNGSKIFLCHCKDERHRFRYHGDEIHVLMIDELTTFTELIYRYLRFRVRMVGIKLPDIYRKGCVGRDGEVNPVDLFPRVVTSSNPGNIGHHWVKRTFGLDTGQGISSPLPMPEIEGGMLRQYIHATYRDNPIGMTDDPSYLARMQGLADKALVKAMMDGDWSLLAGGYFPEFSLERHVLKAVKLPESHFKRRFRAMDWGSAKPFSVGGYGICDEDWRAEGTLGNEILVPRGAIVRFREWYGKKEGEDNKGIKLRAESWGRGILQRFPEEYVYDVADSSIFAEDGGPSIAEDTGRARVGDRKLNLRPADKRRLPGWNQVRGRLTPSVDENGYPDSPALLLLMDNQPDAIRVMQGVQHDETDPEDLDTDGEDHAADEIRYGCMSRPRALPKPETRKRSGPRPWTYDWLIEQTSKEQAPSALSRYRME